MLTIKTKILAGLILGAGAALVPSASASASDFNFSFGLVRPQPVYVQTAVAPIEVVQTRPLQRWIPEHYETRTETVLVPAHDERTFVDAVYEYRTTRFGRTERILVSPAHYENICVPARYETRTVNVLVAGRYVSDRIIRGDIRDGHFHHDDWNDHFRRDDRNDRYDHR